MLSNIKSILLTILVIFLLPFEICSFSDLENSVKRSLSELGFTSIGLRQNIMNQFEVKAKINGKHEMTLIINFSLPKTIFDKESLDDFGIETFETNQSYSLNDDEEDMYAATIDSLNIGSGKINAMDLIAVDYEDFDYLEYSRAGGILGRDFLLKYHAIIDFSNQILYLKTN